ncbi:hypothetical protein ED733_000274 [Metarhizium rileyi]|uniref:HRQ family protein n=1 Tax=Metarhizium rileyi (strain RCEF 4871) TaxID=1649241 RepID=A0A5C6G452_METRR|nr:hypothetical protein ED733_000274 [Metarhizium rileyi]
MAFSYFLLAMVVGGFGYLFQTYVLRRKVIKYSMATLATKAQQEAVVDADYSKIFPPSQRHTLFRVPVAVGNDVGDVSVTNKPLLKLDCDYRLADDSYHVYSGFTVGEIKALGSFPDYASLSGVPAPTPLPKFDIDTARARPYRPFRWPYHQTMSFKKLDSDYWLELESTYRERIIQRRDLYAQHGEDILQALPGSELACKELMEMALQYLSIKYPQQFEVRDDVFVNHILNKKHELSVTEPLRVLLEHLPEDFGITMRDEKTGRYHLRAGMICSSLGWKLGQKIGMGLASVHQAVPSYKEKLAFSMDRFFTKMPTSSPIQRGSWGLEIGQPLFLPTDHPDWGNRDFQSKSLREDDIYLRVDWQTLRRLPMSGAIVFNFKALYTPLFELADEPYIPSLVLKILNEGEEGIMKYKGAWHVEHVAKPALVRYEQTQLEKGLVEEDWVPQTLDESPFFPGWKRKCS